MNRALAQALRQNALVARNTVQTALQVYWTTGLGYPTYVVPNGQRNARATPTHIEMYTGLAPSHVPFVYSHELAHEVLGHTTWRKHLPTEQKEAEADYGGGGLIGASGLGYGPAALGAISFGFTAGGGKHGSGPERAMRILWGMRAGMGY